MKNKIYIILFTFLFTLLLLGNVKTIYATHTCIINNNKKLQVEEMDETKEYYIQSSLLNTKVVSTEKSSTKKGTNILLSTIAGKNSQKFKFVRNSDGSYLIKNASSGRVIDVYAGNTNKNGSNIWLYDSNNSNAQKWYPVKNSDGTYTFYTISGTVMDVYAAATANNTNIHIYASNSTNAQKFLIKDASTFVAATIDTSHPYYILSSINQDNALNIKGASKSNSANLELYSFNKTLAQKFTFKYNADQTYSIINNNSSKAIHIVGNGSKDGTNVVQYNPISSTAQKWYAFTNTDNTLTFISKESGKALNLNNSNINHHSNINIWNWNESNAQKWIISERNYISSDVLNKATDIRVCSQLPNCQMQNMDLSTSGYVFYATTDSYTYNRMRIVLSSPKKDSSNIFNRTSSQMTLVNFGHGSGFDTETIKATNIYKYALWTESVGYGSTSNYAISRIYYIPNLNYNEYNVAANTVTLESSNRSTIILNNPDPTKHSEFYRYQYNSKNYFYGNENFVYCDEATQRYWTGMKVAIDENTKNILIYHNRTFYIYSFEQLSNLKTKQYRIPTNSTYYVGGNEYKNATVTIEAKNLRELTPIAKFSAEQKNALEYCWEGIALDGDYIYMLEGHRASGTAIEDSIRLDGRAFINIYNYKEKGHEFQEKYELKEFNSDNSDSIIKKQFVNGTNYKYKIEVEGIKISTEKNKKNLYIGFTGLNGHKDINNNIGVLKYEIPWN